FLSMTAIAVIFVTDLHHLLIVAIVESYTMFQPGNLIPLGDFAEMATRTVANSFRVAIQIAAPFLAFGLLFYLGVGVLARLMPQVQVFFVIMPVNILLGFILFALLLSVMVKMFIEHFESTVRIFLG
ncbi:MAG: flagellar biosynthetic protein FliR, partial [Fimbriimonadaceae bacterium]|nr:flagellar biosynthetic protein FliR [Alphaproteobacteria bacterium]